MMMQAKLEGCCKKISDVEIFDEFIGAITLPSYCFDFVRLRVGLKKVWGGNGKKSITNALPNRFFFFF